MKTNTFLPCLFALLIIGMLSCAPPPVDEEAVREEITAVYQQFTESFNSQNADSLASLYTANGMLMPPNQKPVEGQESIKNFWHQLMEPGPSQVSVETLELHPGLTETWEVGKFTISDADGNMLDEGNYVVGWKKVDGQWRLHRDIWNSNMPPPEPPATEEEAGEAASDEAEEM